VKRLNSDHVQHKNWNR